MSLMKALVAIAITIRSTVTSTSTCTSPQNNHRGHVPVFVPIKQYDYSDKVRLKWLLPSSRLQKKNRFIKYTVQLHHHSKIRNNEDRNNDQNRESQEERFEPNKPISLPSLENPPEAGPLYNTCYTRTETQKQEQQENDDVFVLNNPIELDSLQDVDRSFFGLQPRANNGAGFDDSEVPLLMETGLGVFTSSIILGGSVLFILSVFLDDGNIDATMIPLSF